MASPLPCTHAYESGLHVGIGAAGCCVLHACGRRRATFTAVGAGTQRQRHAEHWVSPPGNAAKLHSVPKCLVLEWGHGAMGARRDTLRGL